MTKEERCQHPDCIYRNRSDPTKSGNCDYFSFTGKCRTPSLAEEEKSPGNCPRYVSDGRTCPTPTVEWRVTATALYNAGYTDREIAEKVGKDAATVQSWRQKVLRRPPNRPAPGFRSKFDWKKAEELYRHGASDMQIAKALGCCVSAVVHWRGKYELLPNTKRRRKKQ